MPKSSFWGMAVSVGIPVGSGVDVSSTGLVGVFDGAGLGVGVSPDDCHVLKTSVSVMNRLIPRYFTVNPFQFQ